MRFLQTHIHRHERFELVHGQAVGGQPSLGAVDIECPLCGLPYFAPVPLRARRGALRWLQAEGKRHLVKECPDHAHQFTVEEW